MERTRPRRNTRQRQAILEALKKLTTHPTASDMYEIVSKDMPRISLGTVYRNLELLVKDGSIQKLNVSGKEARYDGTPETHAHVRCLKCNRVDDVHDLPDDLDAGGISTLGGYEILGYHLEFYGHCPACKKKKK